MAVISQSESNFKPRQRALSGRLDRGELQTSREMKAWITFSGLPRDKKRPHLFAGLNFSATDRNKKKPNSASVQAVQAVTPSLIGWLSWRASGAPCPGETSDRKLFHTRRSSSVCCLQSRQKFKHICLFCFFFPDFETWLLAVRCALPTMQLSCRQIRLRFVNSSQEDFSLFERHPLSSQ